MTIADGLRMIDAGVKFGDVYPFLDDPGRDGDALRERFCWGSAEPGPAAARPAPAGMVPEAARRAREQGYEGDPCGNCGSFKMLRTGGPCCTCQECGVPSGGCS